MGISPKILLFIALFLPLLAAFPIALAARVLGRNTFYTALIFPLLSAFAIINLAEYTFGGGVIIIEWQWIPSLGIPLTFIIDGLSVFYALIVSIIGVLVFCYTRFYMDRGEAQGLFYCYLLFFMAAMLGTVFSNHSILLFIFWELTGLASFLLIGYNYTEDESRRGARMALLITSITGLFMMAGFIILGENTGTYRLDHLLTKDTPAAGNGWLNASLLLIAMGAFGKSAQFPIHFWLPNAMAAPTPVSAYLHSATMVKLGIFLIGRFFPIFNTADLWLPLLAAIGFGTMVYTAILALLSHDLKAILAYSTISQLGYLIGGYGFALHAGIDCDYLHILNHVIYKGSLFMIVGIIDHATGTRDLRQLGGLGKRMPLLAIVCLFSASSMAGLPGTIGFISKEIMFYDVFHKVRTMELLEIAGAAAIIVTSMVKVAFSLRIFFGVFGGKESASVRQHYHAQPIQLLIPPFLLSSAAVVFGIAPFLIEPILDGLSVSPAHAIATDNLAVWHGFTPELAASSSVILLGAATYLFGARIRWRRVRIPGILRWDSLFERGLDLLGTLAKRTTRLTGADTPVHFLRIIVTIVIAIVGGSVLYSLPVEHWGAILTTASDLTNWDMQRTLVAALIALGAFGVVFLKTWAAQLLSLSVSGFLFCLYYVLYQAPDLALTQILIEIITLILILYLLSRFPKPASLHLEIQSRNMAERIFQAVVAAASGLLIMAISLTTRMNALAEPIGPNFTKKTVPLAHGSNAVNTILVDFRGLDTLFEITVLVIAMLGVLGLVMRHKRTLDQYRQGPLGPPGFGIDHKEQE